MAKASATTTKFPRHRVAMNDVARMAKVSRAVVSRVLNDDQTLNIRPETRERVLQASRELNYRPNSLARSLRLNHSGSVGILLPDISNPFFGMLLKGVGAVLSQASIMCLLCDSGESSKTAENLVRMMDDYQVDGLLVATAKNNDPSIRLLESLHAKYVLVSRSSDESTAPFVGLNTYQGICKATEHLLELGHRKIAHIAGNLQVKPGEYALSAYQDTLREYGVTVREEYIMASDYLEVNGYKAMDALLRLSDPPTAVVACTDPMAISAIRAIHDWGLSVPDDISVTGYNNSWVSGLINPKLTTVNNPLYEMGKLSAETLLRLMDGETIENMNCILDTELIIRESTQAVR